MPRTLPMEYKELQEARNLGIPEYIIVKLANGVEPSEQDKDVINRHGKEYVSVHNREGKRVKPHLRSLNGGRVVVGTVDRYVEGIIVGKALEVPDIYAGEVIQRLRDKGYKLETIRRIGHTYVMLLDSDYDRDEPPRGFREKTKDVTIEKMYSRAVGDYNFDIPTGQEPYDDYLGDRIGAVGEDVEDIIEVLKDNRYLDDEIQDILDDLNIYGEVEFRRPIRMKMDYLVRE